MYWICKPAKLQAFLLFWWAIFWLSLTVQMLFVLTFLTWKRAFYWRVEIKELVVCKISFVRLKNGFDNGPTTPVLHNWRFLCAPSTTRRRRNLDRADLSTVANASYIVIERDNARLAVCNDLWAVDKRKQVSSKEQSQKCWHRQMYENIFRLWGVLKTGVCTSVWSGFVTPCLLRKFVKNYLTCAKRLENKLFIIKESENCH